MKQQLLFLTFTLFLCLTTTQGQESLNYITVESYDASTESYLLSSKEEYTYNPNGQQKKTELYYWDTSSWILSSKEEYTYDSNGNLTEDVYSNWNSSTNQWTYNYRNVTIYTNNKLTGQISYEWLNGAWTPDYKSDFMYVANNIDTFNSYDWIGGQWIFNERGAVTYNSGKISEVITEELINNIWTLSDKTMYIRNATTGKIEEVIYQAWDGTKWKNEDKSNYTIDSKGITSEIFSESDDGINWDPSYKNEYTYDSSKLMSNYFNPFNRDAYFYDLGIEDFPHINKVLTNLFSIYDSTVWLTAAKTTYYYSDSTMNLKDLSDSNFITVYPNPVKNILNITLSEYTEANTSLYDVTGRLVLQQKLQALNTSLNIETLNSGMYLLKVFTDQGFATKRITKN
ncbi:putative secreted protein (Por secretion system target) [Gelidibacter algens]|uniref:Putative secreted protein (Por secretion system target) n=1 Tax=Gelidibacter algens TaxID=49280 RepID=A0A1A7R4M9_9FLAO|nr:T9SS type A sorting domain-containing protein [Gelidibacter algens]OBX26429.1 hypothetical protein A9996_05195 [Gelidibacter algens]RAJ25950.1 putative secreted protein (Por secretion system target) [Gelidibacter algens]